MVNRIVSLGILIGFLGTGAGRADDWPQWRGPDRTGLSKEKGLLKEWPKDGPKLLWEIKDIGGGFSTPAVVGDRIYLMADRDGEEFALALKVADGKEVWATKVGKVGKNIAFAQYPGTRSTPTVDGDRIYVLGSDGDLACLERGNGKVVWAKNLHKDFAGEPGVWAYSESLLIDGDLADLHAGGQEGDDGGPAARRTAPMVWKCAVQGRGRGRLRLGHRRHRRWGEAVRPVRAGRRHRRRREDGPIPVALRRNQGPDANIPTPVFHDDCVFTSTSRNGSGLNRIKVRTDEVSSEQVYYNKTALNSIGGVVLVGDYVYGTNSRGELVCMEFKTGKVKWQIAFGRGGRRFAMRTGCSTCAARAAPGLRPETAKPKVALVEATPDGYREKGRFEPPDHGMRPAWPHPVVANGRLYLRDLGVLLCYDVKAGK